MAGWARGASPPPAAVTGGEVRAGVFVSLYRHGELRGCIGHLEADRPVQESVAAMALAAARDDPRFPPLAADEIDGLEVQLSVLTPCRPARPGEIEPGRHGVVVRGRGRQGVFLPQVAAEQGWDRDTLLTMVCRKAGLPGSAWREPGVEIQVFEAQLVESSPA